MPWGIAASDERANVLWYRSTAPNAEGLPSQIQDIQGTVWDSFEEKETVKVAWAGAIAENRDQSIVCTATRNKLKCRLNFFPIPDNAKLITFSRWSPMENLTAEELQVCQLAVGGQSAKSIADELGVSQQLINKHKRSAMKKLGCSTPEQLGSFFSVI